MQARGSLDRDESERQERIVEVLVDAFSGMIEAAPDAIRYRFQKMAAEPYAFYRGSAPLFYADAAEREDRWVDERTSRVWIQGDMHAENYGTYMNSAGLLVFDVNDFDEAYLGHYTWDLERMAASLALIGFSKALSDEAIREMVRTFATSYLEQVRTFANEDDDQEFALGLGNTDGAVLETLRAARLQTRVALLESETAIDDGHERRFRDGTGVRRLDEDEHGKVCSAFERYLETIPEDKRQQSISYTVKDVIGRSGFGIGSAGLQSYNLLVEGKSQALEDDIVLTMKQGNPAAPGRVVDDREAEDYFEHHGHRTAVSQRALQAHADPWLGWCELDDSGWVVQELSAYAGDLEWDEVDDRDEILPLLRYLGQASAKVHCVSDAGSEQTLVDFQTEEAIVGVIGDDLESFADDLADFAADYGEQVRDDHRLFVDAFRNGAISGLESG